MADSCNCKECFEYFYVSLILKVLENFCNNRRQVYEAIQYRLQRVLDNPDLSNADRARRTSVLRIETLRTDIDEFKMRFNAFQATFDGFVNDLQLGQGHCQGDSPGLTGGWTDETALTSSGCQTSVLDPARTFKGT